MYTDAKGYSWTRTETGRGKRSVLTTVGCYTVEHIATGKFLSGVSATVSLEVDACIAALDVGAHKSKAMKGLCKRDSDLRLTEYPCKNMREANRVLAQIRTTTEHSYLVLK